MVWLTVSSWSCVFWLYRVSPFFFSAKNIVNLISVLTIWWCPFVESSPVLLEMGVGYNQCISWQNSVSLCLASFCTPRPNLPVTPGIPWLPTFVFKSLIRKGHLSVVLVLEGFVGLYRTVELQFLQHYCQGIDLDYCNTEWFSLEMNRDHSVIFKITSKFCISILAIITYISWVI